MFGRNKRAVNRADQARASLRAETGEGTMRLANGFAALGGVHETEGVVEDGHDAANIEDGVELNFLLFAQRFTGVAVRRGAAASQSALA